MALSSLGAAESRWPTALSAGRSKTDVSTLAAPGSRGATEFRVGRTKPGSDGSAIGASGFGVGRNVTASFCGSGLAVSEPGKAAKQGCHTESNRSKPMHKYGDER